MGKDTSDEYNKQSGNPYRIGDDTDWDEILRELEEKQRKEIESMPKTDTSSLEEEFIPFLPPDATDTINDVRFSGIPQEEVPAFKETIDRKLPALDGDSMEKTDSSDDNDNNINQNDLDIG